MKYALIDENNIVTNLVAYDGAADYTPPEGHFLVQVNDWVAIGSRADAVRPQPTQTEILAALTDYMNAKQFGGTMFNNMPIDTDANSRMDLTVVRINAKEDPAYTVDWEVDDNVFIVLDAPTCIAIANAADKFVQKCYSAKKAVVLAIAQYPTVTAALAAFDNAMKG